MKVVNDKLEILRKKPLWFKLILTSILTIILSAGSAVFYTAFVGRIAGNPLNHNPPIQAASMAVIFSRAMLFSGVCLFASLHVVFSPLKIYKNLFKYRWLVGLVILIFMTANRFHGDSMAMYHLNIQPEYGTEFSMPIFSNPRPIRSDEYLVKTPIFLSGQFASTPYGMYNDVLRGTPTTNVVMGVYVGFATLGNTPWQLAFAFLPIEYAYGFNCHFPLIFSFLIILELFLILTSKKKLLSVAGACLIVFSTFSIWWFFPTFLWSGAGTLVAFYHFLNGDTIKKKVLCAIGMAICFSAFLTNLYPAWQVPIGYVYLVIGIWIIQSNFDKIKNLKRQDWLLAGGSVVFIVALLLSYFHAAENYIRGITETVYPGMSYSYGGMGIEKMFNYLHAPYHAYTWMQVFFNSPEASVLYSLFPIPTIMASYLWIASKKKDFLTGGLLLVNTVLILYVTVGLPGFLARITLLSFSFPARAVDILGVLQIFLIVIVLSEFKEVKRAPLPVGILGGVVTAALCVYFAIEPFRTITYRAPVGGSEWLGRIGLYAYSVIGILLIGICATLLMLKLSAKKEKVLLVIFIGVSVFTGATIRPVSVGLDAIYAKPVSTEIASIVEHADTRWMTVGGGLFLPGITVSNGAPTINSTNFYPNLELWRALDPSGKYDEVYNRFSHVHTELTDGETSFTLLHPDAIMLTLSLADLHIAGIDHILTIYRIEDPLLENDYVQFELIYEEAGLYIYRVWQNN